MQWAAAGYYGAINSGKTICGILFGATAFLGFMLGSDAEDAPRVKDAGRTDAIAAVNKLYRDFIVKFGETECKALTGCDFSRNGEADRYIRDQIFKETCFPQFEHVLSFCLDQIDVQTKTP